MPVRLGPGHARVLERGLSMAERGEIHVIVDPEDLEKVAATIRGNRALTERGMDVELSLRSWELDVVEDVLSGLVAAWGNLRSKAEERGLAFGAVNEIRRIRRERGV